MGLTLYVQWCIDADVLVPNIIIICLFDYMKFVKSGCGSERWLFSGQNTNTRTHTHTYTY